MKDKPTCIHRQDFNGNKDKDRWSFESYFSLLYSVILYEFSLNKKEKIKEITIILCVLLKMIITRQTKNKILSIYYQKSILSLTN